MPIDHREIAFEDAIERHLLNVAGYAKAARLVGQPGEAPRLGHQER